MSAIPKFYEDAELTKELSKDGDGNYIFFIGSERGIDGNLGESVSKQLWIKNVGDEIYQDVVVNEVSDVPGRAHYSLDGVTYHPSTITIGDINVDAVATFHTKVVVDAKSAAGRYSYSFKVEGESI